MPSTNDYASLHAQPASVSYAAESADAYGKRSVAPSSRTESELDESISQKKERLQKAMKKAAAAFDFITAAQIRDELLALDKEK